MSWVSGLLFLLVLAAYNLMLHPPYHKAVLLSIALAFGVGWLQAPARQSGRGESLVIFTCLLLCFLAFSLSLLGAL